MAPADPFVHLHVHTEYSLLDGAARIDRLVDQAVKLDMPALAITDHGVMYGIIDFYRKCKQKNIKPILGCEVYVARRTRHDRAPRLDDDPYHLVLLAENLTGYRNLLHLVSDAFLEGFYYKPRVDFELLNRYGEGLVALTGCLAGQIPRQLTGGDREQAANTARSLLEIFGPDRLWFELMDHGIPEQGPVNRQLVELARQFDCGLVATNDAHYVLQSDADAHDVLLCIQTNKKVDDQDRMRFYNDMFYLRSGQEMASTFDWCPEAIAGTMAVAERCNVELELDGQYLPRFPVPDGTTAEQYLRRLCEQMLPGKYPAASDSVLERMEYELDVIIRMGFADYFLIVWDFVRFARSRSIPVGPGRGSVCGSIIAYILEITNIDPLRYGLIFERFLNPDRVTMPDMDIDFCFERRGEVIDYVVQQYGQESVAQIITFGTMAARAAIKDVGRALDLPYASVDRIAKMIPSQVGVTLDKSLEQVAELRSACAEDEQVRRLIDLARAVEGLPRHASVHAAGVVIADRPLVEYVPLQRTTDDAVVTQFPMEVLEGLGLLKMDFLALRTLTVIDDCVRRIQEDAGDTVDIDRLPLDDGPTFELLRRGDAAGVFQLESDWVRDILRDLKPERFEDIIAVGALCRPGPMEHIGEYRTNKEQGPTYLHPDLEPVLAETHGIMIYQEQVTQAASSLAGFTLSQADVLRWAVGKKKPELIASMREQFLDGATGRGIKRDTAEAVFALIERFAGYGFNKSHATAYALIAYQTAYLKANYPRQFMAALLTSMTGTADKVAQYIDDCKRMGIAVLPPDVNVSQATFTVAGDDIRFGLAAVKNVGEATVRAIIAERDHGPYRSLRDFCERVDHRHLNRRALESLIRAGAFDSLGNRVSMLGIAGRTLEACAVLHKHRASGQVSLFDQLGDTTDLCDIAPEEPIELSQAAVLAMEKEVLGLYISGHPLKQRTAELTVLSNCPSTEVAESPDNREVLIAGLITGNKRIATRSGSMMSFLTLEDLHGTLEVSVQPRVYERVSERLQEDRIVLVRGRVQYRDSEAKVSASDIEDITDSTPVVLSLPGRPDRADQLCRLKEILCRYHGMCPVYLDLEGRDELWLCGRGMWVTPSPELWRDIESLLGPGAIREG